MRVVVVGCGSIGRRHARNLLALGCEVVATDRDPGVILHPEWPEAVTFAKQWWEDGPFDAEIIATPAAVRFSVIPHSARPIFIEKPLAADVWSARTIAQWCAPRTVTQVGYMLRWHPAIQRIQQLLLSDAIGSPIHARFYSGSDLTTWGGRAYGSALTECSHEIDIALHLLGPATCTAARSCRQEGWWELWLQHESGAMSTVALNYVQKDYYRGVQIVGSTGSIYWDWASPSVTVDRGRDGLEDYEAPLADVNDLYLAELADFLACVRSGEPTRVPLQAGVDVLEICESAQALAAKAA